MSMCLLLPCRDEYSTVKNYLRSGHLIVGGWTQFQSNLSVLHECMTRAIPWTWYCGPQLPLMVSIDLPLASNKLKSTVSDAETLNSYLMFCLISYHTLILFSAVSRCVHSLHGNIN